MTDRYQQIANLPITGQVVKSLGLPTPVRLERHEEGRPVISGPVLLGSAPGGRLAAGVAPVLAAVEAETLTPLQEELRSAAADAGLDARVFNPDAPAPEQRFKALVFDASGIAGSEQLRELRAFFGPTIRSVLPSGRIIVLATPPDCVDDPRAATAQRAVEGFTRSVAKEVRNGASANLVYVAPGGEGLIESSLRFLLSPKSAYVSGQVIRIARGEDVPELDWDRPQAGRVALVTGASRGIGRAIAETLARDGAHVVGLDVPGLADELDQVTGPIGGSSLAVDITAADAPAAVADHLDERHGGVDVVVHNAGITRDKTLGRMTAELWDTLMEVNLSAPERIDAQLIDRGLLRDAPRIVGVSSISGVAGNAGQTNYATSKAGVIGRVQSMAPVVAKLGATINAVAPGFIETRMTAAMPLGLREAGRRMNSMSQGGLPVDVAETIAWLASPGSSGINGNVVRVCGQSLIGA